MGSTGDRVPSRPVVVRLIAGGLAILAVLGGVLYNLAAYYLSRWWGARPPLSQDLGNFAAITSVALGSWSSPYNSGEGRQGATYRSAGACLPGPVYRRLTAWPSSL